MTLAISVVNPEGIVVAGESRQTFTMAGVPRIGSDSARKVFDLTDGIVAATVGWAFLRPQGAATPRSISSLIEDFRATIAPNASVQAVAQGLYTYFDAIYQWHVGQGYDQPVPVGQVALQFFVGGYDQAARVGQLFQCNVPGGALLARDTNNPGAQWIGQVDVVSRIIKGWDPRIMTLGFVQQAGQAAQQLASLEYLINWPAITLQDAIDFAVAMIQITTSIQRFTSGIQMSPGDVPGVGGPIDIALARPAQQLTWVRRKELHA